MVSHDQLVVVTGESEHAAESSAGVVGEGLWRIPSTYASGVGPTAVRSDVIAGAGCLTHEVMRGTAGGIIPLVTERVGVVAAQRLDWRRRKLHVTRLHQQYVILKHRPVRARVHVSQHINYL